MRSAATLLLGRVDPLAVLEAMATDLVARGALSPEKVDAAREAVKQGRLPSTALLAAGAAPDLVLRALSSVASVPVAPPRAHWIIDVRAEIGVDEATWRELLACAVGMFDGRPLVAFADVAKIASSAALGLPDHAPCVALEHDVRDALSIAPTPSRAAVAFLAPPEAVSQALPSAGSPFGPLTHQPQPVAARPTRPPVMDRTLLGTGAVDKTLLGTGAVSQASLGMEPSSSPMAAVPTPAQGPTGTVLGRGVHAPPSSPSSSSSPPSGPSSSPPLQASAPAPALGPSGTVLGASARMPMPSELQPAQPDAFAAPASGVGPGTACGRFVLDKLLGQGGMATVYLASDGRAPAAVKVVHEHLLRSGQGDELRRRFQREAAAMKKLEHKNIVACLDAGRVGDTEYLATEYVAGGSLSSLLLKTGKLPPSLALSFFVDLLEGLGHAHENGIVHRDLKPDNLLLDPGGTLKIADFGIARVQEGTQITATGRTVGTPAYMSPEQATGSALDGRSDLYSAGVILYELLTGRNPFEGDSVGATLANVMTGKVRPIGEVEPAVPFLVDVVIARLLPYRPDDRLSTAQVVLDALAPLLPRARRFEPYRAPVIARRAGAVEEAMQQECALLVDVAKAEQKAGERLRAGLAAFRATTLLPDHKDAKAVLAALNRGGALRFSRSTTQAIFARESTVESLEGADKAQAHREIAAGYLAEDNPALAAVHLRRCVAQFGNDEAALETLARVLPADEVEAVRGMPARLGEMPASEKATVASRAWRPPSAPTAAVASSAQPAERRGIPVAALVGVGAVALVALIALAFALGALLGHK